jgi:long-chain fatty acid transport protein
VRQWIAACAAVAVGIGIAAAAQASVIVAPTIGGRNSSLVGSDVATPEDGPAILLSNPAGAVGQPGTRVNSSLFVIFFDGQYSNPDIGYDTKSSETPVAPTLWLSTDRLAPWTLGMGVYGSVGAAFNFPGNPAAGIPNRFYSETTIIQLGLIAGREILPGLRLAIQPAPTYGKIRAHYPSPLGAVSFDIDGFGIAGVVGLLYDWTPDTRLGLSYRTPGIVYMSGDGEVDSLPDHVDLHLHLPQSVSFGFAHDLTPRLMLSASARWTDYSQFEEGQLDFRDNPLLSRGPFTSTRATFRYGAGGEYELMTEHVWLRGGVSREAWMMEASSLSPIIYDATDVLLGLGLGGAYQRWTIDMVIGLSVIEDRLISSEKNPAFPGNYDLSGGVAGISIAYRFD